MTDLHTHVLWGLDDGADSFETTKAMLSAMHASGVTHVACTPHADPGYHPFDLELYKQRLSQAQGWADSALGGLSLLSGAEISWTYHTVDALRQHQVPTLNGTHYALIEFEPRISLYDLTHAVRKLSAIGITPVIAHVERILPLVWQPKKALALRKALPVHYQLNAGTLLYKTGPVISRFLKIMLDNRALSAVSSDAHNLSTRPPILKEAIAQLAERTDRAYAGQCADFFGANK